MFCTIMMIKSVLGSRFFILQYHGSFQEIVNAYAEYLAEKKHTSEAALMYSLCEQWEQALDLYKDCGLWHQAFCMAGKLGYKQDQMIQLATTLAGKSHVHSKTPIQVVALLQGNFMVTT